MPIFVIEPANKEKAGRIGSERKCPTFGRRVPRFHE